MRKIGKKIIVTVYQGVEIAVENTWFDGMRLYINQQLVCETRKLFSISDKEPVLIFEKEFDNEKKTIEIYCKAVFTTKIKICIDKIIIGGEKF